MLSAPGQGYIDTYYTRTLAEHDRAYPPLKGTEEADVCVIGGGLAGINTAYGLMQRGQSVVLVEGERLGWGASGRNGGFVARGYAAGPEDIRKHASLAETQTLVNLTRTARQTILDRMREHAIDCGPLTPGVLTVSWKDNAESIRQYVEESNRDYDAELEYWPTDRVRDHCRTDRYHQGFFSPGDFQFHSLRYVHGLTAVMAAGGVRIHEHSKAQKISRDGGGWVVKTAQGSVKARHVVICCAIYSKGLDRRIENAAFPVQTYVMTTRPVDPGHLAGSINTSHAIYDMRFASDYYRVLPDHRVMWGGRVALWANPHDIAKLLHQDILRVYPQLKGHIEPDIAWSGLMCYAPHKMPQIGQVEPGYWYCMGFGGHGLVPTTVGGEAIADAITGNRQTVDLFAPFGLSYAGGRLGRYAAQMVYWWWRARDYLSLQSASSGA